MVSIYVGNLKFNTSEQDLQSLFEQYGQVHSVKLIKERESGRPRGFAFVEMDEDEAKGAIEALDGKDFQGRNLRINEARQKEQFEPRQQHNRQNDRQGGYRSRR